MCREERWGWIKEGTEALSAQDSSEPGDGMAATASGAWVWAALGAGIDRGSWQAEMTKMASSANRGGVAGVESVHHAVAAALAIDMFEDAISLYEEADHLLDALLLARLRLPSGHPMVSHLYGRWADELRRKGNPEMAAACLLAIGKLGPAFADLQECSRPLDGSHTASSFAGPWSDGCKPRILPLGGHPCAQSSAQVWGTECQSRRVKILGALASILVVMFGSSFPSRCICSCGCCCLDGIRTIAGHCHKRRWLEPHIGIRPQVLVGCST